MGAGSPPGRSWEDQRGSYTIEFLGFLPLFFLTALIIWQFALAAYTLVVAESVARDAARAATVERWKEKAAAAAQRVVKAEAPGHLDCRLSERDLSRRPMPGAKGPPEELLELRLTCRVPSVFRFGRETVPMPAVERKVAIPWEGVG